MIRRVLAILTARWFVTLIGAIALCLLIWFLGPLIGIGDVHVLDSELVRLIVIAVILVVWAALTVFFYIRGKKTNDQMVAALTEAPKDASAAESAEELALLRRRLEEALQLLRKSTGKGKGKSRGTRYLYELPWYVFIGPPGSGKTTALRNSGLNFPTAEKFGRDPLRGVGGTRNCDWLLTDQAVLLDTAGRYTTQDSDAAVDQAAWKGFLELLARYRPRQPINGALVAIGVSDIALLSEAERAAHGRAIRKRLLELQEAFGIRFPIYVLLTKADLLSGFVEFFDDLGREDREQVWGMTLPLDDGGDDTEPAVTGVGREFDALVKRLGDRVLERLHRESDLIKRAQIFGFPAQVGSIKEPLLQLLNEIFAPNRYENRLLLRGVYFTSGTQEGTPFDRLMGAMAASFGVERQRLPSFSGSGRSYFLGRLFRDVVFGEASVVSANSKLERRQNLVRRVAYGALAGVMILLCAAWTVSYFGNRALIDEVAQKDDAYKALVEPVAKPVVDDADLRAIAPPLEALRDLPGGYAERDQGGPLSLDFGLYQGNKLGAQAQVAYRRALNEIFLPRLLNRLGGQIEDNLKDPDFVQEALKVYLMLGGLGPLNAAEIKEWMTADWNIAFAAPADDTLRQQLAGHITALLEQPFQPIDLDGRVIADARQTLQQQPLASRIYTSMKASQAAHNVPDWRIIDHAGAAADRVLVLNSGQPLTSGVPGFFTAKGYFEVFLPSLATAARDAIKDAWIMGDAGKGPGGDAAAAQSGQLEQNIANLYTAEYVVHWDHLLGDIQIAPFRNMYDASETLNIVAAPSSPLKTLLVAIAHETDLSQPPQAAAAAAGGGVAAAVGQEVAAGASRIAGVVAQAAKAAGTALPSYGQYVTDHYRDLRQFVGVGGTGPAPIDDMLHNLNDVYMQMNRMSAPGQDPSARAANGVNAQALVAQAARLPAPANGIVAAVAKNVTALSTGATRSQLGDLWQSQVLPFCQSAIANRYPVFHDSKNDVTLDDFAHLFSPGGLLDTFFKTNLAPYVDVSRRPWQWQKVQNADLGLSNDILAQFQRADAIRNSFFASGGARPLLHLQFTPVSLDAGATEVVITIDGQDISYSHGPPRPDAIQWPGPSGVAEGRVTFQAAGGGAATINTTGPWSLFRLFDAATIEPSSGADRLRVTFSAGGHRAVYDIQANSVINPLTMSELRDFRCPGHL